MVLGRLVGWPANALPGSALRQLSVMFDQQRRMVRHSTLSAVVQVINGLDARIEALCAQRMINSKSIADVAEPRELSRPRIALSPRVNQSRREQLTEAISA